LRQFIQPVRIYYEDTDCGGVVYHANYLKFMERARSEWLLSFGYNLTAARKHDALFIVSSAQIDLLKPARLYDELEVVSKVVTIGRVSLVFEQEINDAMIKDKIYCKGKIKIGCVNSDLRPVRIPEIILKEMRSDS
jgi:acyl-CoA thioester hydrolase